MTIEDKLLQFENNQILDRDSLYQLIRETHPKYKDTSIRWVIYDLVKKGMISKISQKKYVIGKSNIFSQKNSSDERLKIVSFLEEKFPNIKIVVYESTLLNEWVNHQIARKIIFIEVEKYFMNDVFRSIYNHFRTRVMLNPDKDELYLYQGELIIVTQLITQAPINLKTKDIKIEKLIVDLYTKDLINEFVNDDEKEKVIEDIFKAYTVNLKSIYAYAKRRNNTDLMKKILSSIEHGGLT
ncbi:MAG: hypothetical protein KKH92_09770 [Firmicutes bacterium]|nr:hypothetical protein [Bacillota bacterium]